MRLFCLMALLASWVVALPETVTEDETPATQTVANGTIADGASILINGKNFSTQYACVSPFFNGVAANAEDRTWYYVWKLIDAKVDDQTDVYYLYNELSGRYIGKTNTEAQSKAIYSTQNKERAGRYKIESQDGGYYSFLDIDNTNEERNSLNLAGDDKRLVNFALRKEDNDLRPNSLFTISNPDDEESTYAANTKAYILNNYSQNVSSEQKYIGYAFETEALKAAKEAIDVDDPTFENFKAFEDAYQIEYPVEGHYYKINSAYPAYTKDYITETYYNKDYHGSQDKQRLHFLQIDKYDMVIPVPACWQFKEVEAKNGLDTDHYYKIVAANTGDAWRCASGNTVVDTRGIDSDGVGIYSIEGVGCNNLVVYNYAATLRSHDNNDNRTITDYLATYSGTDQDVYDIDLRGGSTRVEATEDSSADSGLNNWYIREVTEFNLYFPTPTSASDNYSYRTVYFPFAVQVPEDVVAYTLLDKYSLYGSTAFELAVIYLSDGRQNILPAKTAAILRGPQDEKKSFTILYDETHDPIVFDLVGTLAPLGIDTGEVVYVIDDENGYSTQALRKIGGTDYSYDDEEDYKDTGKTHYALNGSDATYILEHNRAMVKASTDATETKEIKDGDRRSTGVSAPTVTPVSREKMKYFDLNGRLVTNPTNGIFIREDGVKVLVQ